MRLHLPKRARPAAPLALCLLALAATCADAVVDQKGTLRVSVTGKISPHALPRTGTAPIAFSVSGQVSTADQALPPQLRQLKIEINREGRLEYRGLPVCSYRQIQPATNERALAACRPSLVGEGTFDAYIVLRGQQPYPAQGRLLVFNGRQHGKPALLGHIYLAQPFASSFVIVFEIERHRHGRYGTVLTADLAKALGSRRLLTGIEFNLSRRYSYAGARRSYLSSGCPAPTGFPGAVFSMVRTSFSFAGGTALALTVPGSCKVRNRSLPR
jgi:hypothetical protein